MTKEEKDALELERANAKFKCKETWATILRMKEVLATYSLDHMRWSDRFKKADARLAEEDRLTKVTSVKKAPNITLTLEQIREIADQLGVEVDV